MKWYKLANCLYRIRLDYCFLFYLNRYCFPYGVDPCEKEAAGRQTPVPPRSQPRKVPMPPEVRRRGCRIRTGVVPFPSSSSPRQPHEFHCSTCRPFYKGFPGTMRHFIGNFCRILSGVDGFGARGGPRTNAKRQGDAWIPPPSNRANIVFFLCSGKAGKHSCGSPRQVRPALPRGFAPAKMANDGPCGGKKVLGSVIHARGGCAPGCHQRGGIFARARKCSPWCVMMCAI